MMIASLSNYEKRGFLNKRLIDATCKQERSCLDIKTPSMDQLIKLPVWREPAKSVGFQVAADLARYPYFR